ncbi:MAG: BLUF domain-containing protein [Burkholderiales bacterium]|nr:MAG: BLUF domain-containing protein [Burkholderiales bacterium]
MLERLVYISTAAPDLTVPEVRRIVARSQMRNRQLDVTGMLLLVRSEFLQVLEGQRDMLDEVVGYISRSPRHQDIRLIERQPITTRRFDGWHMGLLVTDALADQVEALKARRTSVDAVIEAMRANADLM